MKWYTFLLGITFFVQTSSARESNVKDDGIRQGLEFLKYKDVDMLKQLSVLNDPEGQKLTAPTEGLNEKKSSVASSLSPHGRQLGVAQTCSPGLVNCHGHCVGSNVHCDDGEVPCQEGLVNCHGLCVGLNVHCEDGQSDSNSNGDTKTCEEGLVNCHGHCIGPNVHCEGDSNLYNQIYGISLECPEGLVDCHGHCVSPNVHCEGVTCEEGLVNCHGHCVGPNVHCEDDDSEIEEPDVEESSMIWYLIVIVGVVGAALVLGTAGFIWCKKWSPESHALKKDDAPKTQPNASKPAVESKMSREERAPNESKPVVAVTSEVSPQVALKPALPMTSEVALKPAVAMTLLACPEKFIHAESKAVRSEEPDIRKVADPPKGLNGKVALNVDVESPTVPAGVSAQLDDDLDLESSESVVNMNNVLRTRDSMEGPPCNACNDSKAKSHWSYMNGPTKGTCKDGPAKAVCGFLSL